MKTIKLLLLSLLTPLFAGAMQQNQMAAQSSQPQQAVASKYGLPADHPLMRLPSNWPSDDSELPLKLPVELVYSHILFNLKGSLEEKGNALRSLHQTNRALCNLLSDEITNTKLLLKFAEKQNMYPWETALALRTCGSRQWLRKHYACENQELQDYFNSYINPTLDQDNDPDQEISKRTRFLIRCFPMLTEDGYWPAFTYPAHTKNPERIKNLIKAGMNINHKDKHGFTPLMRACQSKDLAQVKIFLDAGANVLIRRRNGNDAMHFVSIPDYVVNWENRLTPVIEVPVYAIVNPHLCIPNPETEPRRLQILQLLEESKKHEQPKQGCSVQ